MSSSLTLHAYQVVAIHFGLDPARTAVQSGSFPLTVPSIHLQAMAYTGLTHTSRGNVLSFDTELRS